MVSSVRIGLKNVAAVAGQALVPVMALAVFSFSQVILLAETFRSLLALIGCPG